MKGIALEIGRLDHLRPDKCQKKVNTLAQIATERLKAEGDGAVPDVRRFLKTIPKGHESTELTECQTQFLATKLKISASTLKQRPDFAQFAQNFHLDRYLERYGKKIMEQDGHIFLPYKGNWRHWDSIKEDIPLRIASSPSTPWIMGPDGIHFKDMYHWDTLEPFDYQIPPSWGNRYVFEFCATSAESFRMSGDHSWFRLKTPEGEIYSIGKYRPGKRTCWDNWNFPLRVKKGYLQSPDVSEFWPEKIHSVSFEITQQDFEKIKASVEEDKANEANLGFHLLGSNCTQYVTGKLAMIGIRLPTETWALRGVLPLKLQKVADRIAEKMPAIAKKVATLAIALFSNTLQVFLGSWKRDKSLQGRAHLSSIRDFFNLQKAKMDPPSYFTHFVIPKIKAWQESGHAYGLPADCRFPGV
jgi:hypothetical protein